VDHDLPTYITIDEAAELFRVSHMTIRRLIQRGEWPHIKIGRQIRIELAAITGRRLKVEK